MRRTSLIILALFVAALAWPVSATTRTLLFGRVVSSRVQSVAVAARLGTNERAFTGARAQDVAALLKGYAHVGHLDTDRIQPFTCTWRAEGGKAICTPRDDYTPMVLYVAVAEAWVVRGEVPRERLTTLSCYDVDDQHEYHCWYWYGSPDYATRWHFNRVAVLHTDAAAWLNELMLMPSVTTHSPDDGVIYLSGDLALAAPNGVFYEFDCPGTDKQYGASQLIDPRQWILIDGGTRIPFLRIKCPEVDVTTTPQPTLTPTPTGWGTAAPTATPIYTPTPEDILTPTVTPSATPTPEPACWGTVDAAGGLNLREGPSIRSDVIGKLSDGQRVEVFNIVDYGSGLYPLWYQIVDPPGWAAGRYIVLDNHDNCDLPNTSTRLAFDQPRRCMVTIRNNRG